MPEETSNLSQTALSILRLAPGLKSPRARPPGLIAPPIEDLANAVSNLRSENLRLEHFKARSADALVHKLRKCLKGVEFCLCFIGYVDSGEKWCHALRQVGS